jgi:hypothetical protein
VRGGNRTRRTGGMSARGRRAGHAGGAAGLAAGPAAACAVPVAVGVDDGAVDITELILSDHHEQRRRFAILDEVDPSDTATLAALWSRLAAMLEVHAQAEELFFYPELLQLGGRVGTKATAEEETEDAIADHNEIRDGILAASGHPVGSPGWWAGVRAARKANDEHMGEEEHEGLADFRRFADLELRHRIAVPFAAYEAEHADGVPIQDQDPQQYIRDHS